ncbi:unnamed protein product [Vitrella brassicaformis CCMP3155]|uniref:Uncharacterized protein n=1 Tax=Vitrella brassicaformis (strain CCMP3155) TaxID=1169540 RepID=A0A0G4FQU0_VITBC|nr:unnamed protein product [Vitrella brassicaformis CCMP3155]|eukprot:CEM16585.1 unnamed protein product [Vitrella brassicaformis CCMP3155]
MVGQIQAGQNDPVHSDEEGVTATDIDFILALVEEISKQVGDMLNQSGRGHSAADAHPLMTQSPVKLPLVDWERVSECVGRPRDECMSVFRQFAEATNVDVHWSRSAALEDVSIQVSLSDDSRAERKRHLAVKKLAQYTQSRVTRFDSFLLDAAQKVMKKASEEGMDG